MATNDEQDPETLRNEISRLHNVITNQRSRILALHSRCIAQGARIVELELVVENYVSQLQERT